MPVIRSGNSPHWLPAKALSFEDGLRLVSARATAMQKACEKEPSTMAAILGLDDAVVEEICRSIDEVVVPANYNSPGSWSSPAVSKESTLHVKN